MEHICYIIGAWHGEDACIRPREGDFVIAADGGYAALQALGVTADLVVGDFDSLGYVPQAEEVVQHPGMKDDADMMLAVTPWAGGWAIRWPISRRSGIGRSRVPGAYCTERAR